MQIILFHSRLYCTNAFQHWNFQSSKWSRTACNLLNLSITTSISKAQSSIKHQPDAQLSASNGTNQKLLIEFTQNSSKPIWTEAPVIKTKLITNHCTASYQVESEANKHIINRSICDIELMTVQQITYRDRPFGMLKLLTWNAEPSCKMQRPLSDIKEQSTLQHRH